MPDGPSLNGKWQVAFWIMASLCGVWLMGLTNGVIANDRLRINADHEIEDSVNENTVSVREIKTDIKYIIREQQEQRIVLKEILSEVRGGN